MHNNPLDFYVLSKRLLVFLEEQKSGWSTRTLSQLYCWDARHGTKLLATFCQQMSELNFKNIFASFYYQEPPVDRHKSSRCNRLGDTLRKPPGDITRAAIQWNSKDARRRGRATHMRRKQLDSEVSRATGTRDGRYESLVRCDPSKRDLPI